MAVRSAWRCTVAARFWARLAVVGGADMCGRLPSGPMAAPPLPPGPREPAAAQTLEWVLRPTALLRRCAVRHGDAFTLRLRFDDAPMVLVSSPAAVGDVWAASPDVLRRGQSPGPLRRVAGPRSIL